MNTNLRIKVPSAIGNIQENFSLIFFVVVLFSFVNLAQTDRFTAKDTVSYTAEYCVEHSADNANEYDSGNDKDGIINDVSQCFNMFVNADIEFVSFNGLPQSHYLTPHPRAPPKVFI